MSAIAELDLARQVVAAHEKGWTEPLDHRFDGMHLALARAYLAVLSDRPVYGECEDCGQTVLTPIKRFPTESLGTQADSAGAVPAPSALYDATKDLHDYLRTNVPDTIDISTSSQFAGHGITTRLQALHDALKGEPAIYTKEDAEALCSLAIDGHKRAQKFITITAGTPRTDAECAELHNFKLPIGTKEIPLVRATFAGQLERERHYWEQRAYGAEDELDTATKRLIEEGK